MKSFKQQVVDNQIVDFSPNLSELRRTVGETIWSAEMPMDLLTLLHLIPLPYDILSSEDMMTYMVHRTTVIAMIAQRIIAMYLDDDDDDDE